MFKKFSRNPYIIFSPALFYYTYFIIKNKWPTLYGDEVRYVDFARHLVRGFYSPPAPHINLWNGPGYPLILAPLIGLHVHTIYMTLMNAVFQYLAIVFLYKALKLVSTHRIALTGGVLLAVYPNVLSVLPILYTEAFTGFLVSCLVYCITLYYVNGNKRYNIMSGLVLGFLTLTKIIFGYVLIICIAACIVSLLFKKSKIYYLKSINILLIAFAVTVPYLTYTWHITGKVFYWGNSGGMSLYWMSTPYEHEYGDWKVPDLSNNQYPTLFKSAETVKILKKNHSKELKFILSHDEIEQDALFKQTAMDNIKKDPLKFADNYFYNFSRMLFNFPYSYSYQDGAIIGNIIIGSLILWTSVAGIILTVLNWRRVVFPVKLLLLITGVYLSLSGALSAYPRQLDVMVPILIFWTGYLIANIKRISLKFSEENLDEINLPDLEDIDIYTEQPA